MPNKTRLGIKLKRFTVRITDGEENKINELCKKHQLNRSELMRKLIREAK